jgi:hypothetical protein
MMEKSLQDLEWKHNPTPITEETTFSTPNIILHCCNSSSVACFIHIVLLPLELASAKQKNMGGTEKDMEQSRRRKWEKL